MDYDSAVAYLERHIGTGVKPGLDRIATLMEMMGHPEDGYPIVHIAGTNGKTSTCRMVTSLVVAHGLNTGTFTSPHLERIEERISANGRPATREEFAQAVTDVAAFADIYEERYQQSLSYFELTAAMAFAWFAELAVDTAVIEVGLGGRLDATNVARGEVAVVTGISVDHTEFLGSTIEAIATEKLGIVKPGAILVTGPLPEPALEKAVEVAAEVGVRHIVYGSDYRLGESTRAVGGWHCSIEGGWAEYADLYLPIYGRHQTVNLATAVAAVEALLGRALDQEAVRQATATMTSPGRMEMIPGSPPILLDGAHNAEGFHVLGSSLAEEFPGREWVVVLAAMEDKDLQTMLPALAGRVKGAVTTRTDSPRALPPVVLAELAGRALGVPVEAQPTVGGALQAARVMADAETGILVTGSLYLVGAVRSILVGDGQVQRNER
jgi:dihydrofolate synthase/folylpolyglutamate synthase